MQMADWLALKCFVYSARASQTLFSIATGYAIYLLAICIVFAIDIRKRFSNIINQHCVDVTALLERMEGDWQLAMEYLCDTDTD